MDTRAVLDFPCRAPRGNDVATPVIGNPCWRFGVFEVDTRKVELRRDGKPVKIREQSFLILVYLLEHAGEIVTREELCRVLWPSDTFVDFEHSLNMAVMKLRESIGESTDTPLYIETIPRRGYRFIAPVLSVNHQRTDDLGTTERLQSSLAPEGPWLIENSVAENAPSSKPSDRRGWKHRWPWTLAAAALGAGMGSTFWYLSRPLPPPRITSYPQIIRDTAGKNLVGTDGPRLFLNSSGMVNNPTTGQGIEEVAISGGAFERIPVPVQHAGLLDVSADGLSLLIGGDGGLWSFSVSQGPLRFLNASSSPSATWSPDGKSMVYRLSWKGEIGVARGDGSDAHMVAPAESVSDPRFATSNLAWSPDGKKVRFARDYKLWEMAADGSGLHPLLPGWHPSSWQCCGRWTPDGRFFLFLLQDPYTGWALPESQLWVLDERRGLLRRTPPEPIQLTSGPIRWSNPIPCKDGKRIFARGSILHGELVRFDAQSHQLQPFLGGISAESVSFSPDGQFVAYVSFPDGILWSANRDGSNRIQLTDAPLHPYNPRWSPYGSQILFAASDPTGNKDSAYTVSSRGGTPHRILPKDEGAGESDPNWSPDERKVVFCVGGYRDPNSEVRILDLSSQKVNTLYGSVGMCSPRWSPDGRFIAAVDQMSDVLKVFDFQTKRWSVLTKRGAGWPAFSRDGQFIYFMSSLAEDEPGVYRVRISGGEVEHIVDTKGFRHSGWVGSWMALDPTDAPMLLRDTGSDDIYALTLETK